MDKKMSPVPSQPPFWKDEPDFRYPLNSTTGILGKFLLVYRFLIALFIIGGSSFLFYQLSPVLTWAWLLFIAFSFGLSIYRHKRKKLSELNIAQIQQRARLQSGASVIGSAIHVAGHPLLEREQPVVLALASDGFKIYSYDNPNPIDNLSLNQLAACHTVVYDDERVPHIDTVDSAAQALQITLKYDEREITCLFRKMRKVRPIDWYHEFQKAQWQLIRH
jgi:hypothetical protein